MKIAIVSNFNGIGLTRDWELLRAFLGQHRHEVFGYQYDAPLPEDVVSHDLAIFLEVVPRNMLELAPVRWAFLNQEWCKPDVIKTVDRHMDKIFAKTREAQRIFDPLFPGRVFYTGFLTRDQYDPSRMRYPTFLHVGGNSSLRGTRAVMDAWRWKKDGKCLDAELIVVTTLPDILPDDELPNVVVLPKIDEKLLQKLQNECLFHIYPSATEGFGHAMRESLSVGAVLITTDAPPMNEIDRAWKLPAVKSSKYGLADIYEVSALDIFSIVTELRSGPFVFPIDGEIRGDNVLGRGEFQAKNTEFEEHFLSHFATKPVEKRATSPKRGTGLQIAFIGNFAASESTENMIKWALEEGLGHDVEMLQENEVNLAAIRSAAEYSNILLWVRTPGWLNVPNREMVDFLDGLKIPSLSVHLDKFFSIPEREALVGVHPFWRTKFVFTADGSRDEDFKARGVNHIFMPPAASAVYSHPGTPWDMYRCDVGFVGARGYHSEHLFRAKLIDFLEKTYHDRFKLIEGLRGHGLNDFYASCKVAIADCFGGGKIPRYWSDRMVETPMRHGFLLSPKIEGMTIPLATFEPENLTDLHEKIEYWLSHESERKDLRSLCASHVAKHDTWTIRMAQILETIGR